MDDEHTSPTPTPRLPITVTTTEMAEDKPLVQPYAAAPVLELAEGVIICGFCGNTTFRRSRLRFHDLTNLLMLRYPVRCTRCSQRQYNDYAVGFLALPPKDHGPRLAVGTDTWANWTEKHAGARATRPMSTAVGSQARRLDPLPRSTRSAPPPSVPSRSGDDSIW